MEILNFIKKNNNWEEILTKPPFSLKIVRDGGYVLLKYNQVDSDFSLNIVKEARGIIIKENILEIVCFPFTKFFNIDEKYADKIDWKTAKIQEKIDGSLMKLWYNNGSWHLSTNGNIDAFKSPLIGFSNKFNSFGDLFLEVFDYKKLSRLNKNYTYMFELVSPYNRVVVHYPKADLYHIGTRNNITGKEMEIDIGIKKPKEYFLRNEGEVREAASKLSFDKEGYVVVDSSFHRVKVKSPAYVNAHHLINNRIVSKEKILKIIIENEQSEFLSYFPEYKKDFKYMEKKYKLVKKDLKRVDKKIRKYLDNRNKKEFALFINSKFKGYEKMCFQIYDKKIKNWEEYIENMSIPKIIERIDMYER